jgi:polyribonucleotide nucleotidyltransferase
VTAVIKEFQFGQHTVKFETGEIARQASGAVMCSMGDTSVLVTCVVMKDAAEGRDFFPLTVDYQERTYAAGKIPGGFFRREGRPSEKETLTSRLIDRPLRPLFPKGYKNEVQVIATVVSLDPEIDAELVAMIGAAAACSISGAPFNGPLGAARVGYKDGAYLLNPSLTELADSDLDLMVAGTEDAVLMVESEANLLSEEVMLGAVMFGHEQLQSVVKAIAELAAQASRPAMEWSAPTVDTALADAVIAAGQDSLTEAYQISDKQDRYNRLDGIRSEIVATLSDESADQNWSCAEVSGAVGNLG